MTNKNPAAVSLGKRTSQRKKKTSAENGKKAEQIRARLTIYGHEDMSDHEFTVFKEWITKIVPATAKHKRGDLSKIFRQTLYKQEPLENKSANEHGKPRNPKARGHSRKWYELNGLLPKKTQQTVEN